MADGDQGVFDYPGLTTAARGVLSASVTIANGIMPSVTKVSTVPFDVTTISDLGTATWTYGGVVSRSFPDSTIRRTEVVNQPGGLTIMNVFVVDRRWQWATGVIFGEYNIPLDDKFNYRNEKTPRELVTLCLEEMGEVGYDVTAVPNDVVAKPYTNWMEGIVPAAAMQGICSDYSLEVVLMPDNTVKIVETGVGATAPAGFMSYTQLMEIKEIPSKIAVYSAPTEFQVDLLCEPVGFEVGDDEPKLIDDLSYAPTGANYTDYFGEVLKQPDSWIEESGDDHAWLDIEGQGGTPTWEQEETLRLARNHIFRSWRVKWDEGFGGPPGLGPYSINDFFVDVRYTNGGTIPLPEVLTTVASLESDTTAYPKAGREGRNHKG